MAESSPSNSSAHYTTSPASLSTEGPYENEKTRRQFHEWAPAPSQNTPKRGKKNKVGKRRRAQRSTESDKSRKLNFRGSDVICWPRSDQVVIILIWSSLIAGEAG